MSRRPASCRLCGQELEQLVADLGATPLANDFLHADQLSLPEPRVPLRAVVCTRCWLVQLDTCVDPHRIFSDYAYVSSYSETYRAHADSYAAALAERQAFTDGDLVVELASNDGYLLRRLAERGADVLGVEPAANIAAAAVRAGIPTLTRFFSAAAARELVETRGRARLVVANNVLAHVPDLNDFVAGVRQLLAPGGLATLEVHHALRLIEERQFDHIYHEHFQYFSLGSARRALARHDLAVVDVEEVATEGGSLRLYVRHAAEAPAVNDEVGRLLAHEVAHGLEDPAAYARFAAAVVAARRALRSFLQDAARAGRTVVAYGAAAKGNTLLNASGVGADLVAYAVDRNPRKQGLFLPGSHIPIYPPERVFETRPDLLLLLPWNLEQEIVRQMRGIRAWGGQFVVPLPVPRVIT